MIILIGLDSDLHLDAGVLELLKRQIPFIRINPNKLNPKNTKIKISICDNQKSVTIETYSGVLNVQTVHGVWCRYALETLTSKKKDIYSIFIEEEFFTQLKGALLCIPSRYWINDPFMDAKADNKPYQLHVATACGLHIPETLFSQEKSDLVNFANTHDTCVIKALGDAPLVVQRGDDFYGNYTSILDKNILINGAWNQNCPVLLQRFIPKDADIRVTVVDGTMFAAQITLNTDNGTRFVDFRNLQDVQTSPFTLPEDIQYGIRNVLTQLGLRYAAIDFSLHDETLYFLEANVSGNYLWTEIEAGLPVTQRIIDALVSV